MKTLCRVLGINRSTYYKHYNSVPADRTKENQVIASKILHIYAHYNKRLGAYKITHILQRDYGIHISVARVYRLFNYQRCLPKSLFILTNAMKTANVPIISRRILTKKPLILSGSVTLHISKQTANGTISAL